MCQASHHPPARELSTSATALATTLESQSPTFPSHRGSVENSSQVNGTKFPFSFGEGSLSTCVWQCGKIQIFARCQNMLKHVLLNTCCVSLLNTCCVSLSNFHHSMVQHTPHHGHLQCPSPEVARRLGSKAWPTRQKRNGRHRKTSEDIGAQKSRRLEDFVDGHRDDDSKAVARPPAAPSFKARSTVVGSWCTQMWVHTVVYHNMMRMYFYTVHIFNHIHTYVLLTLVSDHSSHSTIVLEQVSELKHALLDFLCCFAERVSIATISHSEDAEAQIAELLHRAMQAAP